MKMIKKRIVCIALAIIATLAVKSQADDTQAPKTVGERFLVEVNGSRLLQSDVDRNFKDSINEMPEDARRRFTESLYKGQSEEFISRVLLIGEAKARGLVVTDEEALQVYRKNLQKIVKNVSAEEIIQRQEKAGIDMKKFIREKALIEKLKVDLTKDLVFSPEEITAYRKTVPETVHVRHIAIKIPLNADAEVKAKALEKAEDVRKQLLAGADFAAMAKSVSDDFPSKLNGGELEPLMRGKVEKSFNDAAFSQKEKEIGPVVQTSFAYHIIQVLDRQSGDTLTREDVLLALKSKKAETITEELLKKLREKAIIRYPK